MESGERSHPAEPGQTAADLIARADVAAARSAIAGIAVRTPSIASGALSERVGTAVSLKAECLQGTGSFKLRGALNKVSCLGERASAGLITASAGNHGRALAQAARVRGLECEVIMPRRRRGLEGRRRRASRRAREPAGRLGR